MNIGQVLNGVYDELIGWRPSSGAIKPVHVANGLVRALVGRYYDTSRIHELIVWWKKGRIPDEAKSFERLLQGDSGKIFRAFARSSKEFEAKRRLVGGILASDRGVFPAWEKSDLTLTCPQMTSRSGNDRGLGEFGAALIDWGDSDRDLGSAVKAALHSDLPRDPVTAVVWPLLDLEGSASPRGSRATKALSARNNREFVEQARLAASDLATHERAQGNRLRTLERAVQFICVGTVAHAQALSASGKLGNRRPLLLTVDAPALSMGATASEMSIQGLYEDFELWLRLALASRVEADKGLSEDGEKWGEPTLDGRSVRARLMSIGAAERGHAAPEGEVVEERMADFEIAKGSLGSDDPSAVIAETLVSSYLREYQSGGPRNFLQGLGTRAGFLYPHFQGRNRRKRVRPSVSVLDMLVRACVPASEAIPAGEFFERLWMRFGLIVGGRRTEVWDDLDKLHHAELVIDAQTAHANVQSFIGQLERMGLARRYADNVTFIGDGHVS